MTITNVQPPLISVIIPTWNRAGCVGNAIRSVLAQTYTRLEILVCDDGSTDETEAVVRGIQVDDSRVIWVGGAHGGLPAVPRNRGIELARGDWVAFLDSDDAWFPDKLERQMAGVRSSGADAVCCNAKRLMPGGIFGGNYFDFGDRVLGFSDLIQTNYVITSSVMLRRSVLAQIVFFPETRALKVGEDYAFWLRLLSLTGILYMAEPLVIYSDQPALSVRGLARRGAQRRELKMRVAVFGDFCRWAVSYGELVDRALMGLARRQLGRERYLLVTLPLLPLKRTCRWMLDWIGMRKR